MAVLPESGGPTNSRALPLDFDFPRVYDMARFKSAPRGIRCYSMKQTNEEKQGDYERK